MYCKNAKPVSMKRPAFNSQTLSECKVGPRTMSCCMDAKMWAPSSL